MHCIVLANSTALLDACIKDITNAQVDRIAVDLEGIQLCRHGRISIVQIFAESSDTIWLIDVTTLGATAFDYKTLDERSIRGVLEDPLIVKVFYDVRSDADALFNLYGVDMRNVLDLQLLEVASRRAYNLRVKFVSGLGKAIETYLNPPASWKLLKEAGTALFAPEKGGSYEVFEQRPLNPRLIDYCAQDVAMLFGLQDELERRINLAAPRDGWGSRVLNASLSRAAEARSTFFEGKGPHRAIAPIF